MELGEWQLTGSEFRWSTVHFGSFGEISLAKLVAG